jgi:hypothetical protein
MRVAAIVVFVSVLSTPSEASQSCMTKTEARQHFGSVHIYWHGRDRCWDATPTRRRHRVRQVHKVQRTIDQPKIAQPKWYESMSEMLPDEEPVRAPWVDRWVDIEPRQLPIVARWVDIVRVTPPPIIERKPEPMVTLRGAVMVIITIAVTLVIIERLFGGMIYERLTSRRKYTSTNGARETAINRYHEGP